MGVSLGVGLSAGRGGGVPLALSLAPVAGWMVELGYALTSGKISSLTDITGHGHPATQISTASARPTLVARSGLLPAAARFAGSQRLGITGTLLSSASNWTLCAVSKCTNISAGRAILSPSASGGAAIALNTAGAGNRNIYVLGLGPVNDGPATTSPELVIVRRNSATLTMAVNGASQGLDLPNVTVFAPTGTGNIGSVAGTFFQFVGDFYEGFVWPRRLSDGELAAIAEDVSHRYDIF